MKGISYPLEIIDGNLATSSDADLLSEQILSWFETYKFERVQPNYGIPDMVGTSQNYDLLEGIIKSDLIKEFPNVVFSISTQYDDSGFFVINVQYKDFSFNFENDLQIKLDA